MIFCFDIDGTLCSARGSDYVNAEPYASRIARVNALYEQGHTILIFTARGASSGLDWRDFTARQLSEWGIRYHELILGKPHADVFVDDKAVHSDAFAWQDT